MILPSDYQQLNSLPDDPQGCVTYGKQTPGALCVVSIFPIAPSEAMDFNGKEALIDGIHNSLASNQAIIEVDAGRRKSGLPYIYSLIKTHRKEEGVQYFLLMHLSIPPSRVIAIKAFFDEYGVTGVRDTNVWAMFSKARPELSPEELQKEWFYDPYDPNFQAQYKMNISEQEKFDALFPDHPLSQCRQIIQHFKENF